MLKLLITLVGTLAIGAAVLQTRQQRLELYHQANQLHRQIDEEQTHLWAQQYRIALVTAPNAVRETVRNAGVPMSARDPLLPPGGASRMNSRAIDPANDPSAEGGAPPQ